MPKDVRVDLCPGQVLRVYAKSGASLRGGINKSKRTATLSASGTYVEGSEMRDCNPTPPPPVVDPPPIDPPPPDTPTTFDATFVGIASGNQGPDLAAFIEANRGSDLAIRGIVLVAGDLTHGAVRLDGMTGDAAETTITFLPGAKVKCTTPSYGIFELLEARDITFYDANVQGSGYTWVDDLGGGEDSNGVEDGFGIYGCQRITLVRPHVYENRGDAVYVGSASGPVHSVDIVMTDVNFFKNARNGIAVNCGNVDIIGGTIDRSGLHSFDMEPNTSSQAATIDVLLQGVAMTRHDDLPIVAGTGYAVAGGPWGGGAGTDKINVRVIDCSADDFTVVLKYSDAMTFTGNSSTSLVDGNSSPFSALEFDSMGTLNPANTAAFNAANTNIRDPSVYTS